MVSPLTLPHMRSRRSSNEKKNGPRRPPPLKLESSFFKADNKGVAREPAVRAVRGSVSDPFEKETDLPLRRMANARPAAPEKSIPDPMETPTAAKPRVPEKDAPADEKEDTTPVKAGRQAPKRQTPEPIAETRPVSPQESLRNIIHLDFHDSDDDPDVSPLSEGRPPVRTGNGSALTRFFPELSSNISLVSPVNAQPKMEPRGAVRRFETELEERVHTLYMSSADAVEDEEEERVGPSFENSLEQITHSSSGSDETFDAASSCYSRRSSVTSVDTHYMNGDAKARYKSADAFSIISPAAAGVFDDAASYRSKRFSRAPLRFSSRVPSPTRRPSSVNSVDTHYVIGEAKAQYKSADAFSIISPAAAGVFDDAASVMSRAPMRAPSRSASPASTRAESPPPVRAESPALTRAEFPDPMPSPSETSSETESPGTMRAESPASTRVESPTPMRVENASPMPVELPALMRAESPASVRDESPAPLRTDFSSSMPVELPAMVPTRSPASERAESPPPMYAEYSSSMPAELPAMARTESPASERAESPAPIRAETSSSMSAGVSAMMRTESPASERAESPAPIRAETSSSISAGVSAMMRTESPASERAESPASEHAGSSAPEHAESLAPMYAEYSSTMPAELPAMARTESPASERAESPAPIRAETSSSMSAGVSAMMRTESPASERAESPAPIRAETSSSISAGVSAMMRTESPASERAESPTSERVESAASAHAEFPSSMPAELPALMRTESPTSARGESRASERGEFLAPMHAEFSSSMPAELPAMMRTESSASMRAESPAPVRAETSLSMPAEFPAMMRTESPTSMRVRSPAPMRGPSPSHSRVASPGPPRVPIQAGMRVESPAFSRPPTRGESPAPMFLASSAPPQFPMRSPMQWESPGFTRPPTRSDSPATMRVASPAPSRAPSQATSRFEPPSPRHAPGYIPGRAPSIASTTVSTIAPSQYAPSQYAPSPSPLLRVPTEGQRMNFTDPWRTNSVVSKVSLHDLKNKPLPLEPVAEPSPLDIRRTETPHSALSQRSLYQSSRHPSAPQPRTQYSSAAQRSHSAQGQPCHGCGGGPHHDHRVHSEQRSRRGRRPEWTEHSNGSGRLRHIPTLSRAAEELEEALAGLANDPNRHQKTLLILDGPLQISRHNGDLVAARPAPLPPSIQPYSIANHSQSSLGPAKTVKKDKAGSKSNKPPKQADEPKERKPSNLKSIREAPNKEKSEKSEKSEKKEKPSRVKEDSKDKSASAPKKDKDEAKIRKSADEEKRDDKKEKPRLKKSFTLSMRSFNRKPSSRPDVPDMPGLPGQRMSVLSSRSENSLDPALPVPNSKEAKDAKAKAKPRLSRHLSLSDPKLGMSPVLTPNKVDDLRMQLPRLQTQDLGLKGLIDKFGPAQEARSSNNTAHPADSTLGVSDGNEGSLPPRITPPPEDEKILVTSDKMRQNHAFVSTAQASSAFVPPEHIYELAATPPTPSSLIPERAMERDMQTFPDFPVEMPDGMIVSIMEEISSLDDLFNFVLVNKRFFRVFKQRELALIKNALFRMSPPAWELRELSPPWAQEWQHILQPDSQVPEYTPSLYLDRYAQDIFTLAQLKSMILVRCSPFLRRDTVRGLSGVDAARAEEVDDAFWRIWTFCRIFGNGKGRENDIEGQKDWLKGGFKAQNSLGASMTEPFGMNNVLFEPPEGFARGNKGGLSPKQLYDMTEIWTCLSVLLQPLHGKCIEAREIGIFDGMDVPEGDAVREETVLGETAFRHLTKPSLTCILEEWTAYVLTLGLSAVLTLSSLCPAEATTSTFSKAKLAGLTKWELTETETSRSSFLKEAVSRVYEDQERSLSPDTDSPDSQLQRTQSRDSDRERRQSFALELRARRLRGSGDNGELGVPVIEERPMSEYSTVTHDLDGTTARDAPPVPPVPPLVLDRSSTSTTSTGTTPRTPNPTHSRSHTPDSSIPLARSHPSQASLAPPPLQPQIQDPVDRAISRMVNELGFKEDDVKWALKITDTGEGIDAEAAEQLLKQQRKKNAANPFAPKGKNSLLMSVMKRQGSQESGWRWA
ncbi:uncharacterized protein N7459_009605 [Penicillium hispanicum]|uniref:uncharacterized protein n=1 Tax=Penicillium hispanicum TaxID=1080232 RepID=UPI00254014B6|nr:uncharacterized protein N7459_009605 [Penicillium hispanicum]KAJ5570175.1 hypothetical protein N7459_009605 [Penicillium hispanicum]